MVRTASFLSSLPDGALSLIVRRCSSKWFDDKSWQYHIAPKTMCTLLQIMPHTVQRIIRQVSDLNVNTMRPYFRQISGLLSTVVSVNISSAANAYHVGVHGKSVQRLRVSSLHDEEILAQILGLRGKQLIALETSVTSFQSARLIASNCAQLRELNLTAGYLNPEWTFPAVHHGILQLILPRVGRNLNKLETCLDLCSAELNAILTHCSAINTLNLRGKTKSDAHAALLACYGRQLQRAHLPANFTEDNVFKVVARCPNAELSVVYEISCTLKLSIMIALGRHVVDMHVFGDEISMAEVQEIWVHCTALRKFSAGCGTGWKDMVRDPFPKIASIRIMNLQYILMDNELIEAIGKNTSSLEELKLWLQEYMGEAPMQELVNNNKLLSRVSLRLPLNCEHDDLDKYHELSHCESSMTCNTVRTFSKCTKLRELLLIGHDISCLSGEDGEYYVGDDVICNYAAEVHDVLRETELTSRNVTARIFEISYWPYTFSEELRAAFQNVFPYS